MKKVYIKCLVMTNPFLKTSLIKRLLMETLRRKRKLFPSPDITKMRLIIQGLLSRKFSPGGILFILTSLIHKKDMVKGWNHIKIYLIKETSISKIIRMFIKKILIIFYKMRIHQTKDAIHSNKVLYRAYVHNI